MVHATFEVTAGNFQEQVIGSALPVLVEFTADWCPPCKMLAPTMHALATKYQGKLSVGMLDSDLYPELVQRYGVMGLPTLILFSGGQPVQRMIGYQPKEKIEAQLQAYVSEPSDLKKQS
jgi:thioredoxin 1